jgi:hypothetical protein
MLLLLTLEQRGHRKYSSLPGYTYVLFPLLLVEFFSDRFVGLGRLVLLL